MRVSTGFVFFIYFLRFFFSFFLAWRGGWFGVQPVLVQYVSVDTLFGFFLPLFLYAAFGLGQQM